MLQLLKDKKRFKEVLFLGLTSFLCLGFSIFRIFYTETGRFLFLNWNLFLASIPWLLISLVVLKPKIQDGKLTIYILL